MAALCNSLTEDTAQVGSPHGSCRDQALNGNKQTKHNRTFLVLRAFEG